MSCASNNIELVDVTLGPGSRPTKTNATRSSDVEVDLLLPVWSQPGGDMLWGQNDIVVGEPSMQHQETKSCEIPEEEYPVLHISNGEFSFETNGLSQIGFDVESSITKIMKEIETTACNAINETGAFTSGGESTRVEHSMADVVDVDVISKACEEQSTSSEVPVKKISSPREVEISDDNDFVCQAGMSSTK